MKKQINLDILLTKQKEVTEGLKNGTKWQIKQVIKLANMAYELGKKDEKQRILKLLDEIVIKNVGNSAKTVNQIIKLINKDKVLKPCKICDDNKKRRDDLSNDGAGIFAYKPCSKHNNAKDKGKKEIIQELARLESMNWAKDKKIAHAIFPYVLMDAINMLMNSKKIDNPVDYFSTGKKARKMIDKLINPC